MMEYILAIDQSTSATKAFLFDREGKIRYRADRAHEQIVSPNGWISHDPLEIYRNTLAVVKETITNSGVDPLTIRGAGISNQRETALVWDRDSGLPVTDAVVWQCARSTAICEGLAEHEKEIRFRTGLRLSPFFSAGKIAWILRNTGNLSGKKLCAGTIDSWLIFKLTGNFRTDFSNASRTQLFNIRELKWDDYICGLFGIDIGMLPQVCDSNSEFGMTDFEGFLKQPVPVRSVMGDSHASLFGHGCLEEGMGKATYGTGSSVMINTGSKILSGSSMVTSLAWGMNGKVSYVLEGNINYSCAVIKWLVDDLKLITSPEEAGKIAAGANPLDSCYLVPAFSGLGAPYWKNDAKACLWGMTRTTGRAEIVKAAEESIAYQIASVLKAAREESSLVLRELRADGAGAKDTFLMQFQSDILDIPVSVSEQSELSAAGVAYMAGSALGLYDSSLLLKSKHKDYFPDMKTEVRERLLQGWEKAVSRVIS